MKQGLQSAALLAEMDRLNDEITAAESVVQQFEQEQPGLEDGGKREAVMKLEALKEKQRTLANQLQQIEFPSADAPQPEASTTIPTADNKPPAKQTPLSQTVIPPQNLDAPPKEIKKVKDFIHQAGLAIGSKHSSKKQKAQQSIKKWGNSLLCSRKGSQQNNPPPQPPAPH